ncbi:MAG: hypothetical protein ACRDHH_07485 [Actinomycetota bacterium]
MSTLARSWLTRGLITLVLVGAAGAPTHGPHLWPTVDRDTLGSLQLEPLADCGVTPIDESYGARLEIPSGRAGDPLVVAGTTYRDEGGRWAPSDRIEVWWDYNSRWGPPGVYGSHRLLSIDTGTRCAFRTSATVPNVEPGVYAVTTLIFDANGYGIFGEDHLAVEA